MENETNETTEKPELIDLAEASIELMDKLIDTNNRLKSEIKTLEEQVFNLETDNQYISRLLDKVSQ